MKLPSSLLAQLRSMPEPLTPERDLRDIPRMVRDLDKLTPVLRRGVAVALMARAVGIWKNAENKETM